MAKDIGDAAREVCLSFPEAEETVSHGAVTFKIRGKVFAYYVVNHHGDGRVALHMTAPPGAQAHLVASAPKHFFVPPYVGPRGWIGVNLDKGISWKRVAALAREAYERVAPRALLDRIGKTIEIAPPKKSLSAVEMDPMQAPAAQKLLKGLRKLCLELPETSESKQFGSPVFLVGKKTFAHAYHRDGRMRFGFWVGVDRQGLLTADPRFEIPPYMGHNGWITLDVTRRCDWNEVRALALDSYRHFALRRILRLLGE